VWQTKAVSGRSRGKLKAVISVSDPPLFQFWMLNLLQGRLDSYSNKQ